MSICRCGQSEACDMCAKNKAISRYQIIQRYESNYYHQQQKIDKLEKELKKLNTSCEDCAKWNIDYFKLAKRFNKLETENKRLKREIEDYCDWCNPDFTKLRSDNAKLVERVADVVKEHDGSLNSLVDKFGKDEIPNESWWLMASVNKLRQCLKDLGIGEGE